MKRTAILQSNYIPWKGYFDIINMVDEFILYDEVQYTKNDWRNRNQIKTPQAKQWLTIPIKRKSLDQKICESEVADRRWAEKHWKTIQQNYQKAVCFKEYKDIFQEAYLNCKTCFLSEINAKFILLINQILGIETEVTWSHQYQVSGTKVEKLVSLCKASGATEYISGPAGQNYIDESQFKAANIKIVWMDYQGYPEYRQLYPPFTHTVSMIDLIFNEGQNARTYMKSF